MPTDSADTMIHIDEALTGERLHQLVNSVRTAPGVTNAALSETDPHLLLVKFDAAQVDAKTLLRHVTASGVHAELVGL